MCCCCCWPVGCSPRRRTGHGCAYMEGVSSALSCVLHCCCVRTEFNRAPVSNPSRPKRNHSMQTTQSTVRKPGCAMTKCKHQTQRRLLQFRVPVFFHLELGVLGEHENDREHRKQQYKHSQQHEHGPGAVCSAVYPAVRSEESCPPRASGCQRVFERESDAGATVHPRRQCCG